MLILNKILKYMNKFVRMIIYIALLIVLLFGGYSLWDLFKVYDGTRLDQEIIKYRPKEGESMSLVEAQKLNPDIKGWIRIDGTKIDYPIVRGVDNFEYLNLDYKREYSLAGSIFMDYRNSPDFTDKHIVLYGHNINGNLMFADVRNYRFDSFFKEHETGHLFTDKNDYKLKFFSYMEIDSYDETIYNVGFSADELKPELINAIKEKSSKYIDIGLSSNDQVIMLSTCFGDGNARSLAIAKVMK